jgi:pyruvate dehydrogenase E2 component (dihydrolipoamide acetyltransferase)
MSVSVSMPQLGESVTEGTVTRWLKREGERVEADEPLLEVSTDKVDTEIPSPVSGILRGITVAEDETVAVGAELAVIDEEGSANGAAAPAAAADGAAASAQPPAASAAPPAPAQPAAPPQAPQPAQPAAAAQGAGAAEAETTDGTQGYNAAGYQSPYQQPYQPSPGYQPPPQQYEPPAPPPTFTVPPHAPFTAPQPSAPPAPPAAPPAPPQAVPPQAQPPQAQPPQAQPQQAEQQPAVGAPVISGTEGPYVTPLVRKLATEHGIDLAAVAGTGVGGRIRKQDVLDAARELRGTAPAPSAPPQPAPPQTAPPQTAPPQPTPPQPTPPQAAPPLAVPPQPPAGPPFQPQQPPAVPPAAAYAGEPAAPPRPAIVPSSLRGTTQKLSRSRQLIAQRMVESLQISAQLTTVVEADVTAIARLRDRAKAAFEAREGVKLSFLPFFALATVEALKVHPKLNAVIDTASGQVTYHDDEHLGIAVDTERGLMVPVIRQAGDLNIAGLARKIADLAERTRAARVSPDELSGGTFTLTNTGSRGALFDTPIINQPQVGILGTGTVVKRPVVVDDPALGEVITVRSMVYLALTYDHRLVDGADAARFLNTLKNRLEEGAFESELGL